MRRPFNALAEGLVSENSWDDKTVIELFLAGLSNWSGEMHRCLRTIPTNPGVSGLA
jgi:hypothetical protein